MGKFYSPELHRTVAVQKWDAIVIGSGLGGMTTASLLAKAGKKVLVLERHAVPGGFTHTFARKGFEWDVGVHYVGQMSQPKSILRVVFDFVTGGKLKWVPMGQVYDRVVIDGDVYEFVAGADRQLRQLLQYFPDEEPAIRKYFELVRSVGKSSAWFFGEKTMPRWLSKIAGRPLRMKFERLASQTTYEVLSSLTRNEKLISVLCAQCGNYGLTPKKSSFGIHAIVVEHYLEGGSYPSGGARRIHESILSGFAENGGMLVLKAEVAEILIERGQVTGLRMRNGEKIFSPVVVSNAGVRNTFLKLMPPELALSEEVRTGLETVKASKAHICLYVGLNGSDEELAIPKNNVWLYDRYEFDGGIDGNLRDPGEPPFFAYVSCPSAKDPEWPAKHAGKATLQVLSALDYELVKKWEAQPWMKRGEEYLALKSRLTEQLLQKLYEVFPQIRGRVEVCELSTPLSTRHFMNYSQGEIYGLEHTPARFRMRWLRPETSVKGLFLTGQDIVTVGAGGALMSGVLTAIRIFTFTDRIRILFRAMVAWRQMKKVKRTLIQAAALLVALGVLPLDVPARAGAVPQAVTEQELAQKLRMYESLHTLEVSFTQTKVLSDIDVHLSSEGHFKIIRPSRIIWEITKPSPVRVTMDKTEIRIESGAAGEAHTQVLKLGDSLPDKTAKSMTGLIAWLNLDAKSLSAQYLIFHGAAQEFRFEPRDKDGSPFRDLLMTLGGDGHLKHLRIHEISGDTLDIEFGKPKIK